MSDIISQDIQIKKQGRGYIALCPFHKEKTPSFQIDDENRYYYCFGCKKTGSVFNYIQETKNMNFKESVEFLADIAGVDLSDELKHPPYDKAYKEDAENKSRIYNINESANNIFINILKTGFNGNKARDYLEKRGFNTETIDKFKIGFCDGNITKTLQNVGFTDDILIDAGITRKNERNKPYDFFANRITFPIYDLNNNIIGFGGRIIEYNSSSPKYFNSKENIVFHKGAYLYNMNKARQYGNKTPIIVVEGYIDVISMTQNGFEQTVASLGTALTEAQIELLWKYCDKPILCFDGDSAGVNASIKAALKVLPLLKPSKTLMFCYLPKGLDPEDVLKKGGRPLMADYLNKSLPLHDVLFRYVTSNYIIQKNSLIDGTRRDSSVDNEIFFYDLIKDIDKKFILLPEDQIALKKELFYLSSKIENIEIRKLYKENFELSSRDLISHYKSNQSHYNRKIDTPLKKNSLVKLGNIKKEDVSKRILLGILLKNPILLVDLAELFAQIDFGKELNDLKNWLLEQYFLQVKLDDASFLEKCSEYSKLVITDDLIVLVPFLFDDNLDIDKLSEKWNDIWRMTIGKKIEREETIEAMKKFRESGSVENWKKFSLVSIQSKTE